MSKLSWSYSMYSQALTCLACFEKNYILGEKQAGPESADLLFGTACHSAVNAIWNGEDGEDVFRVFWGSLEGKELAYSRLKYDQLKAVGEKLLATFKKKYADRCAHESSEIRLQGEHQGVKLNGQYDFYGQFDGVRSLLDLKTAAYAYPDSKKDVALQLNLYAYLCMQNGYKVPEQLGYLVFCKNTGCVQTPLLWKFDERKCVEFVHDMVLHCKMFETLERYPKNPNAMRHNYACFGNKETE